MYEAFLYDIELDSYEQKILYRLTFALITAEMR